MPNLCLTQAQAVWRPKSGSRKRAPALRSIFWTASRAFSIEIGHFVAAELLQVAVAEAQVPAGVDHLGQGLPVPFLGVFVAGQVLLEGLEAPGFRPSARPGPWRSSPPTGSPCRGSRGRRAPRPAACPPSRRTTRRRSPGRGTGRGSGRSAGRSSPGSAACSRRRRGSAGGSRRPACAARPSPRRIRAGSCGSSKLRSSTFFWAPSMRRETMRLSMASPSFMPSRVRTFLTHSPAKIRIRSSSSER